MTKVILMGGDKDGDTMLVLPSIIERGYLNVAVPKLHSISFVEDNPEEPISPAGASTGVSVETYQLVCYAAKDNLAVFQLASIVDRTDQQVVKVRASYSPRFVSDPDYQRAFAEGLTEAVIKSFEDM